MESIQVNNIVHNINIHEKWKIQELWTRTMPFAFNTLLVGQVFKSNTSNLLFGTIEGKIRIYNNEKKNTKEDKIKENEEDVVILETKGGAISAMVLHDVTKFGAVPSIDLIVGDVAGNVLIFSNYEIFRRQSVAHPVSALSVNIDIVHNFSLIVGDYDGRITAFESNHEVLWKQRFGGAITCIKSVIIPDFHGVNTNYILVAFDGSTDLHFYNQGIQVKRVSIGSKINSISVGYFKNSNILQEKTIIIDTPQQQQQQQQIALGCEDGWVYLLDGTISKSFYNNAFKFIKVGYTITQLLPFPMSSLPLHSPTPLLCSGYFNGIQLYHNGKLIIDHATPDWVHTMAVGDLSNDQEPEIVIGMHDNTCSCFKIKNI